MKRVLKTILKGAAAGGAATLPMSAVMLAAQEAGLMGEQPPNKIAGAALDTAGAEETSETQRDLAASAAHLGYGLGAGALFTLGRRRLKLPGTPVVQGIGYGLAIWALSYKGWVPALGIMPPPGRDRPGRPAAMIAAHVVFGATLGVLADR